MSGFFAGTCIYRSKLYSKPYIQNISGLIVKITDTNPEDVTTMIC